MPRSGFSVFWKKRKAVQLMNFYSAMNRIKNNLKISIPEIERVYKKRLLSKSQKDRLINMLEKKRKKRK